jgi:hypothetical protein
VPPANDERATTVDVWMVVALVKYHIEQHYGQDDRHTYSKYRVADFSGYQRACDVTNHSRNSEFQSTLDVKHTLAYEGEGGCEVLQNNSNAVSSVGYANEQTQHGEKRHRDDSTTSSQRVDYADQDSRHNKKYFNYILAHKPTFYSTYEDKKKSAKAKALADFLCYYFVAM